MSSKSDYENNTQLSQGKFQGKVLGVLKGIEKDIGGVREYVDIRFQQAERSTDLARSEMERRLEGMNEFRDTLKDQAARFVTREELNAQLVRVDEAIRSLELSRAELKGKASQTSVMITLFLSAVGLAMGLINLLLK